MQDLQWSNISCCKHEQKNFEITISNFDLVISNFSNFELNIQR